MLESVEGYVLPSNVGEGCKCYASRIKYMYNNTPVVSKELTEDGQAWKLTCLSRTYNEDEDLTDENYVNNMRIWYNYISAYDESYIGSEDTWNSFKKFGLVLWQKAEPSHKTASIAFSPKENKWYGWSHRAIYGFTIGDVVKEGDLTATCGYIEEYAIQNPDLDKSLPVGYKADTLERAKRMAIAFAEAVS